MDARLKVTNKWPCYLVRQPIEIVLRKQMDASTSEAGAVTKAPQKLCAFGARLPSHYPGGTRSLGLIEILAL